MGEEVKKPKVAITLGDANGIGPEVTLKSLADEALLCSVDPVIVGSEAVLEAHAYEIANCKLQVANLSILEVGGGTAPAVQFGKTTKAAGALAVRAIEKAVDLCLEGAVEAMVTAPISKEAVRRAGFAYPGHTEFIAARTGSDSHMMLMVSEVLRVGLVSAHVPLRDAHAAVTQARMLEKLRILTVSLRRDFGIDAPRIAVLGLNPHAGDGGVIGREEIEIIAPALEAARAEGLPAEGPFPADGFFGARRHEHFDAVLATYHDQGLVPFKTLSFGRGVNFTAGLPIVRTSPDHGTAFDLAGQDRADAGSMKAALRLACTVARRRTLGTTDD